MVSKKFSNLSCDMPTLMPNFFTSIVTSPAVSRKSAKASMALFAIFCAKTSKPPLVLDIS